mgnify:FL=1
MSIEGLQAILEKKEVVPTFGVEDLHTRPAHVEADYLYHVRTYLPVSRAGEAAEGQLSVRDFEKRLVKQVTEGRAPRGYITAGYGYGKTTTALYLWRQAQQANLVIVPPFTLSALPDLLSATYGWLRYKLGETRPAHIAALDALYGDIVDRSLDRIAQERALSMEQVQGLWHDGLLNLAIRPAGYIEFFEKATAIALNAGFDGLVVVPDEIQQYFRPKIREGGDPIAPFFDIINLLNTRAMGGADLRFGFVMIITLEELAQIRDTYRRTDLLHRMKDLQIDLTTLYDEQFAPKLWDLMATHFDFEGEKQRIADPETLVALGQITARKDISDGPRTAINVFRRMVARYLEHKGKVKPYTPIDLITDFLDEGAIAFAGNDKIRTVTRQKLSNDIVRADFERYAPAIKLAAAFPTDGVPRVTQEKYGQQEALADLMHHAIGEIVRSGAIEQGAIQLVGLDPVPVPTAWLPTIVREFRLGYHEDARITQDRAEEAFIVLLKERIFPKWKLVEEWDRSFVANRSLIFEGAFDAFKSRFPRRRVHVRLLWEDEPVKDADVQGDVCVEFCLSRYYHLSLDERRQGSDPITERERGVSRLRLNLLLSRPETLSPPIQDRLKDVWSPYDLTPLVLMNIYQLINEKRAEGVIPKREDALIQRGFQPEILDHLVRALFNQEVGQPVGAAGAAIIEYAVGYMLDERYPNYSPLIVVQSWESSLKKYLNALRLLELPAQRQGQADVEMTKEELAKLFPLSNTGLDSFQKSFGNLLRINKDFRGTAAGIVRFTLHPLEEAILDWLRASPKHRVERKGGKPIEAHCISVAAVHREAAALGYVESEISMLIEVLQTRDLVDVQQDWIIEREHELPSFDELRKQCEALEEDLALMAGSFGNSSVITDLQKRAKNARQLLSEQMRLKAPDPVQLQRLMSSLRAISSLLEKYAQDQQKHLCDKLRGLQRIRHIQEGVLQALDTPLTNDVEYVDQVNALRVALHREAERIQEKAAQRRQQLAGALRLLEGATLSYSDLAGEARAMEDYAAYAQEANRLVDAFEAQYQHFGGWRELVIQGAALTRDLGEMDPEQADALWDEFNRLSTEVRGEISSQSNRLAALPLSGRFLQRLSEITASVQQIRGQAREAFNRLQQAYMNILANAEMLTPKTWQPISFNPRDPRDSHERLLRQVQAVTLEAARHATRTAKDLRQTLISVLSNLDMLDVRSQQQIEQDAHSRMAHIELNLNQLFSHEQGLANLDDIRDIGGVFSALVDQIKDSRAALKSINQGIEHIRKTLNDLKPTPDEMQILDALGRRAHAGPDIDIVELQQDFDGTSDRFWLAIRGLQQKDRIRIAVQRKDA